MKTITLIPLVFLTACTSTKYQDQSKHYTYSNVQSNYQRNHQEHRQIEQTEVPKYNFTASEIPREEIVYKQSDSDYLASTYNQQPTFKPQKTFSDIEDVGQYNCKERTSVKFPKHHHPFFPYPFFQQ